MIHIQTPKCQDLPSSASKDCGRPGQGRSWSWYSSRKWGWQLNSSPKILLTDHLDQLQHLQQGCVGDRAWSRSPRCWCRRRPPGSCRRSPWRCWWRPPPRWRRSWPRSPWRRARAPGQTPHLPPVSHLAEPPSHWRLKIKTRIKKIWWQDLLLPMSMITMLLLLCCLASSSQVVWEDAGNVDHDLSMCLMMRMRRPYQVIKCVPSRNIIHKKGARSSPIIRTGDRPECLLASL